MIRYFEINAAGNNIRCKLYYNPEIKRVVVFGHGFAGHKDNGAAEKFANTLLAKYKDVALMIFNWPCHGDDVKKKIVLEDCSIYLMAVTDYIKTQLHVESIYAYATSFGGYLFLKYISDYGNPFKKTALRCPAVNMYDVLTKNIMKPDEYEKIQKGKPALVGFDRKIQIDRQFLSDLQEADIQSRSFLAFADDLLIIHGTEDEVVPFEASRRFAENNVIEFVPVEGADHRFVDSRKMDAATKAVLNFLEL